MLRLAKNAWRRLPWAKQGQSNTIPFPSSRRTPQVCARLETLRGANPWPDISGLDGQPSYVWSLDGLVTFAGFTESESADVAFYGVKKVRLETVKRPAGFRGAEFSRLVIAVSGGANHRGAHRGEVSSPTSNVSVGGRSMQTQNCCKLLNQDTS